MLQPWNVETLVNSGFYEYGASWRNNYNLALLSRHCTTNEELTTHCSARKFTINSHKVPATDSSIASVIFETLKL